MSLHTRLTSTSDDNVAKIGIHSFVGAVGEFFRGRFTGMQVRTMFDLDANETNDAQRLKNLLEDAPNKQEIARVLKDVLYMAETGDAYTTEIEFWDTLEAEVVRQGGTVS